MTPPLGPGGYVFPVVGTSAYVDTYGAFRSDVPGKWHHGDDILALLGTPVVAVADGTMNRVGWEKVGGWRLWVRDASANEFYYAHLSGYAPSDFHSNRVKVGEVVGFIGNTGDAFNGAPHLHFEIHPHQLLGLGYVGAVDPTSYLDSWRRLRSVHAPYPVHPQLPGQPLLRIEARYVFRELLAARHLIDRQPTPSERPAIELPAGLGVASVRPLLPVRVEQALPRVVASSSRVSFPLLAGLLTVAGFAGTLVLASAVLGRRWR